MKITIETYGKTTSVECDNDIDINELKSVLFAICVTNGWNIKLLNKIFKK